MDSEGFGENQFAEKDKMMLTQVTKRAPNID